MADPIAITLMNPHADDFFRKPVSFLLAGRKSLAKYEYLVSEPIRKGQKVDILVDGTLSSVIGQDFFNLLPAWLRRLILAVEIWIWITINDLRGAVNVHWTPKTIKDRKFIYVTSYKNCVGAFGARKDTLNFFNYKIVNLSHYFIRTEEKARNISKMSGVIYTAEADLRQNAYFKNFFDNSRPFLVAPFAVPSRFTSQKPLDERLQKCAATGSFHNLYDENPRRYYEDFLNFFGCSSYHPIRKLIYDNKEKYAHAISCRISPYREAKNSGTLLGKLLNFLNIDVRQKNYFSFDIVDFYNDHVFAIVGEELSGLPPIGFFEAMACGCIVFGEGEAYYQGLDLTPGVHYLSHDGTLEGIVATMEAARQDPATLTAISNAARAYVDEHCRNHALMARLLAGLRRVAATA